MELTARREAIVELRAQFTLLSERRACELVGIPSIAVVSNIQGRSGPWRPCVSKKFEVISPAAWADRLLHPINRAINLTLIAVLDLAVQTLSKAATVLYALSNINSTLFAATRGFSYHF